ncbi:unnamed protein product [Gemmata massiliana]|uniref:Helix-turn-helix domain-containing protein n=1 Tax=Gemmata massiliana TaxID=1210884 RepID=A0A6P2CWR0_9BACT|nr:helix-turn-helix domain-containing protein [Gemmata massiliana]VTR93578.1 unnamed protein product [Gemmata massiliana]
MVKPSQNSSGRPSARGRDDFTTFVADIVEAVRAAGCTAGRGFTTAEVARRYRVSEDRVRAWIKSGLLKAVNTADVACGKPRFVVLPEALAEFERTRSPAPLPKVPRRRRPSNQIDFFPDSDAA